MRFEARDRLWTVGAVAGSCSLLLSPPAIASGCGTGGARGARAGQLQRDVFPGGGVLETPGLGVANIHKHEKCMQPLYHG